MLVNPAKRLRECVPFCICMADDEEYWNNTENRIHEVEAIMKLTAKYVLPTADNGVPNNFTISMNNQPTDFAQGYGLVQADKAVALALTLEDMRRTDDDITLMEAYHRYFNISTNGTTSEKTNVLATSWTGDWSMFTDPENGVSSFTTDHPRQVYVHNRTARIIVDLQYEPLSSTEYQGSSLWVVIDYNGDGSMDWSGDSSFSTEGIRHDEIDLGGGGAQSGQLWHINVQGRAIKIIRPEGPNFGENEFNEAIIEYRLSIQMVFDIGEEETIYYETGDFHARIAQPEFGEPTQEYSGNGSLQIKTYFYDLTKIYIEEVEPPKKSRDAGFPFWLILLILVIAGILVFYFYKDKIIPKKAKADDVTVISPPTNTQVVPSGQIVEAEVVAEPAASD